MEGRWSDRERHGGGERAREGEMGRGGWMVGEGEEEGKCELGMRGRGGERERDNVYIFILTVLGLLTYY